MVTPWGDISKTINLGVGISTNMWFGKKDLQPSFRQSLRRRKKEKQMFLNILFQSYSQDGFRTCLMLIWKSILSPTMEEKGRWHRTIRWSYTSTRKHKAAYRFAENLIHFMHTNNYILVSAIFVSQIFSVHYHARYFQSRNPLDTKSHSYSSMKNKFDTFFYFLKNIMQTLNVADLSS